MLIYYVRSRVNFDVDTIYLCLSALQIYLMMIPTLVSLLTFYGLSFANNTATDNHIYGQEADRFPHFFEDNGSDTLLSSFLTVFIPF